MATESFPRDGNNVPITTDGLISTDTQVLTGSNATVAVPIFKITGSVEVRGLWAVVTTVLGANNTAAYFRVNDGTNTPAITVATGTTLTAAPVGSLLVKNGLAGAAVTLVNASQSRVNEPTTLETTFFSPFIVTALPTATTNIEFVYSTTDTPTTGAIKFSLRWLPLVANSNVTSL